MIRKKIVRNSYKLNILDDVQSKFKIYDMILAIISAFHSQKGKYIHPDRHLIILLANNIRVLIFFATNSQKYNPLSVL